MSEFGKFRVQQIQHHTEPRGMLPTVSGIIAAFAVGALAVLCWDYFPPPGQWKFLPVSDGSSAAPTFSGNRIGRATTAPLLKVCLTKDVLDIDRDTDIDPGLLLQFLEAASTQGRVTAILGAPKQHAVLEVAAKWGMLADCVYSQNSWNLCDMDNRALAVDAANAFLGQAGRVISQPENTYAAKPGEVRALSMTKDRVVASLKNHAQNGVLIASDFGAFSPPAVRHVLGETKPIQNGCAKQ